MRPPTMLIAFLVLPILEIATFIYVGQWIGVLKTVLLVVFSAILGIAILRRQGFNALNAMNRGPDSNADITKNLAEGALIVLSGILLVIPGFLTDIIALLLLVAPIRHWIWKHWAKNIKVRTFTDFTYRNSTSDGTVDLDLQDFRRTDKENEKPDQNLLK